MKLVKLLAMTLLGVMLQSISIHAGEMPKTLFEMAGVKQEAAHLSDSVLVIIDAQREYVDGKLPLADIEQSIHEAAILLALARKSGTPVIHVIHRGKGALFNPDIPYFKIVPQLSPVPGEAVVEKTFPNAFAGTDLAEVIARTGRKNLILIGYMTHMCVSSTARAALDLGFRSTIVASATATRDLPDGMGGVIPASTVQATSMAALADRFSAIVQRASDIQE